MKIQYHLPPGIQNRVELSKIQKALTNAWYTVGIFPIRALETVTRRASLKVDMELKQLLTTYFETKPEYKATQKDLIDKALHLEAELFDKEHN